MHAYNAGGQRASTAAIQSCAITVEQLEQQTTK